MTPRLQIASFLILHALNLVTTLTAKTALDRQTDHSPSGPHVTPLDTGSPLLSSALAQLIASHHPNTELVVHVAPAIQFRAVDLTLPATIPTNSIPENTATGSLASLDRFMSKWTRLVGDPVFSKWIVIALALSLFLNGYLLKGIASGSDSGFAPGSAAEAAARILLASTGSAVDLDEMDMRAKMRRRWSAGVEGQDLQKEWTTEDAAAMTKGYQRRAEEAKQEADKPAPTLLKVTADRRHGDDSSDEDSPPPSPIFVRTKLRKAAHSGQSTATSLAATTAGSSGPMLSVSTEREIHLSPSTVALVPLGSIPDTPRSLDVCAKIFDNGVGAMLLNDEEIILLVQKGKVAAYALEKLLKDYERSVAIRRALICAFSFSFVRAILTLTSFVLQPALQPAIRSKPPTFPTRTSTTRASWASAARTSSASCPFPSVSLDPSASTTSSSLFRWRRPKEPSWPPLLAGARRSTSVEELRRSLRRTP